MLSKEEHILLQAEILFAEKGFSATSTREIAKAAQVNVSMIAYYFGSKEKLFEQIFIYRMQQGYDFIQQTMENATLSAIQKLEIIIERYVQRVRTMKNFYLILQREQLNFKRTSTIQILKESKLKFLHFYQKIVEMGKREGIFTKTPDVTLVHATISGTLFTAMNMYEVYQEFTSKDTPEDTYYQQLTQQLKDTVKLLVGYDEK